MYKINSKTLNGTVKIPPSKSYLHRALMASALSNEKTIIKNTSLSKDIEATIDFIRSIGANVIVRDTEIEVLPNNASIKESYFANESGTTLRLSIPILIYLTRSFAIRCSDSLIKRPLDVYDNIFGQLTKDGNNILLNNNITPGKFVVDGSKSSQFISGLLMILPLLNEDSTIEVINEFTSISYVEITVDVLKSFGIEITREDNIYYIKGNQSYISPKEYTVEGDFSQAAFFFVANKLGSNVKIEGLNEYASVQGDRKILEFINTDMLEIDVTDTPDLVPVLSIYLATLPHNTALIGTKRLMYKESDRVTATKLLLESLGGKVDIYEDSMIIHGNTHFEAGKVSSFNDHRIAMSACIASTVTQGSIELDNIKCIDKSYVNFINDFTNLGGNVNVK